MVISSLDLIEHSLAGVCAWLNIFILCTSAERSSWIQARGSRVCHWIARKVGELWISLSLVTFSPSIGFWTTLRYAFVRCSFNLRSTILFKDREDSAWQSDVMASSLCDTMEQVLCCMYCLDSKMITPSSPLFEHLTYSVQRIILCRDQVVSFVLQNQVVSIHVFPHS